MKNPNQIIKEEMRKLIKKSCKNESTQSEYYKFQKALLKFYFNTIDVTIDYESRVISLWNSKPRSMDAIRLFDINEAVSEKVRYTNLEETLKGCLEDGDNASRFYKTMLFYYNNVKEEVLDGAVSA
ncbi:hypothetical protein ACFQO1_03955 [Jejudonia soesokkakensis]|uniref:Uncharacterized protein n=1 Tax=Jejudonia soesokkakensis TaxID=1323432 RepID=A0ABW2MSP4_9FLAO